MKFLINGQRSQKTARRSVNALTNFKAPKDLIFEIQGDQIGENRDITHDSNAQLISILK